MSSRRIQRGIAVELLDRSSTTEAPPKFWVQSCKSGDLLPLFVHKTKWSKVVTRVENVTGDVKALAKALQRALGTGGSVHGSAVEVQGDQRDAIAAFLLRMGAVKGMRRAKKAAAVDAASEDAAPESVVRAKPRWTPAEKAQKAERASKTSHSSNTLLMPLLVSAARLKSTQYTCNVLLTGGPYCLLAPRPPRATLSRLARRRTAQRWSALVSAPGSRLARQMQPHLGPELWAAFVAHANRHYKVGWLRAFAPESGVLRCVGTLDGVPRPHAAAVGRRAGGGAGTGGGAG